MSSFPALQGQPQLSPESSPRPAHSFTPLPATSGDQSRRSGFTRLDAAQTGITFTNRLSAALASQNQILLNGSGVAAGDFDGDGLCDLYFCTLTSGNRLYRNLGGFQFQDVTDKAGVGCEGQFSTGTVLADLDADGWPDLLVNSLGGGTRFFHNRGNGTFEENSNAGFKRTGGAHSIALADIDGDGDLDVYVANYRVTTVRDQPIRLRLKQVDGKLVVPSPYEDRFLVQIAPGGRGALIELGEPDILYINQGQGKFEATDGAGGRFLDSEGVRCAVPPRDWGLTALFCDLNGDLRPDLYVCNDFSSPDRLWFNQGQGLFRASRPEVLRHTSWASMAVDVADIDRDGRMDFFVSDMISQDLEKRQMQRGNAHPSVQPEDVEWDRPQYLRNTLQWNAGDGTFREIALMAGLEASEWTWGVAFIDVDLDGYEDLLLANGHAYDMQDSDATDRIGRMKASNPQATAEALMTQFPPLHTQNVAFRNRGDLTFEPMSDSWGFSRAGISHSLILADLDNDGDSDVVTTDLNQSPGIYRNESTGPRISVRLAGPAGNSEGIGAEIRLSGPGLQQIQSIHGGGRYMGGDQHRRTFAFPWSTNVEARMEIRWPSGEISSIDGVNAQQSWMVRATLPANAPTPTNPPLHASPMLRALPLPAAAGPSTLEAPVSHSQTLVPFDLGEPRTLLTTLKNQASKSLDLIYARPQERVLQRITLDEKGEWTLQPLPAGSSAVPGPILALQGLPQTPTEIEGHFTRLIVAYSEGPNQDSNPTPPGSTIVEYRIREREIQHSVIASHLPIQVSDVAFADVDQDGDQDLFVAGRAIPNRYPEPASSLWFRQEASSWVRESFGMKEGPLGLATAAATGDIDGDGRPDLVVACEWGLPRIYLNQAGRLHEVTEEWGLTAPQWNGLWSSVLLVDLDHDNRCEIILGNAGPNHPWNRFLTPYPLRLYYADWNQTGQGLWSCVESARPAGRSDYYPLVDLETLRARIPSMGQQFESNQQYARTTITHWPALAEGSVRWLELGTLQHVVLSRRGGRTQITPLPKESQMTNIRAMASGDINRDGHPDVFLAQNGAGPANEKFRHDAGRGLWLAGDGKGGLQPLLGTLSGVEVSDPQTSAEWVETEAQRGFLLLGITGRKPEVKAFSRGSDGPKPFPKGSGE